MVQGLGFRVLCGRLSMVHPWSLENVVFLLQSLQGSGFRFGALEPGWDF